MSQSDFKKRLSQFKKDIDDRVELFFATPNEILDSAAGLYSQKAVESIREFSCRPSKRVRGALVLAAYEACGGKNISAALDAVLAIELQHNYLLIIDDVMDKSITRRGKDTVHEQYKKELHDAVLEPRIAEMMAVNIGILAQHIASELASKIDEDPEKVNMLNRLIHRNLALTCFGQIEDLTHGLHDDVSEQDILQVYTYKSGFYTFINPLLVGIALAGAHGSDLDGAIKEFGVNAGVAYQLQDDIIGLFGNAKDSGKPVLDDLREGKMTLLMNHALRNTQTPDRERLKSILGNETASEDDRDVAIKILEKTGSRSYCEQKISKSLAASRAALRDETWPIELRLFLDQLLEHLDGRRS